MNYPSLIDLHNHKSSDYHVKMSVKNQTLGGYTVSSEQLNHFFIAIVGFGFCVSLSPFCLLLYDARFSIFISWRSLQTKIFTVSSLLQENNELDNLELSRREQLLIPFKHQRKINEVIPNSEQELQSENGENLEITTELEVTKEVAPESSSKMAIAVETPVLETSESEKLEPIAIEQTTEPENLAAPKNASLAIADSALPRFNVALSPEELPPFQASEETEKNTPKTPLKQVIKPPDNSSSFRLVQAPLPPPAPKSKPTLKPQRVIVPFSIDGQEQGQVMILLTLPDNRPTFPAKDVLDSLANAIIPEVQKQLTTLVDAQGNLSLEALNQAGLIAKFDPRKLELEISIPPDKRNKTSITLYGEGVPPEAATALPPSDFSGYSNLRILGKLPWTAEGGLFSNQPILMNLESAVNYQGWVLENYATFFQSSENLWQRNYTGLVHDDLETSRRYYFGDFSLGGRGFQGSYFSGRGFQGGGEFLGAVVSKNLSLQPYQRTTPNGRYEFFLENAAKVKIFLNGALIRELILPAGPHDLQNLNLATGLNQISLEITDEKGNQKNLNFAVPFDFSLLAAGLEEYAYGLGVTSSLGTSERLYDFSRPTLILAHRLGLTDTFTLEAYLQAESQGQLLSLEGLLATEIGPMAMAIAYSRSGLFGDGYAARVRYRYQGEQSQTQSNQDFEIYADYLSPNFTFPGQLQLSKQSNGQIVALYRRTFFEDLQLNFSATYFLGGDNIGTVSLGFSKSIGNGISLGLNVNKQFNSNSDQRDLSLGINFSWSPGSGQTVSASTDLVANTRQISWSSSSSEMIGGWNSVVTLQNDNITNSLGTSLDYTDYRGKIGINHSFQQSSANSLFDTASQIQIETAIAFADGEWAITRPIRDSFALIVAHPNLEGQIIEINPSQTTAAAQIDAFGNAVFPDLQSYRVAKITVDAPDLPAGYDLGPSSYNLLPTYKSGTLIRIGSDATVIIRGILTDTEGKAIALKLVELKSLEEPNRKPISFFTNRIGKFVAEGLKPGSYEGTVLGETKEIIRFTIPAGQAGVYDLGTLKSQPLK